MEISSDPIGRGFAEGRSGHRPGAFRRHGSEAASGSGAGSGAGSEVRPDRSRGPTLGFPVAFSAWGAVVAAAVLIPALLPASAEPAPGWTSAPPPLQAGEERGPGTGAAPDSVELMREAREAQAGFEAFRMSRIPPTTERRPQASCDERIGRFCIWFGGAGELDFPPEPPETGMARNDLVRTLSGVNFQLASPWALGQLVHYLVEVGSLDRAEREADRCGLDERWWCDALRGFVLHVGERFVEAEEAFEAAVAGMSEEERLRWLTPRFVVSRDVEAALADLEGEERKRMIERFWRFSDPLFMLEWNDRLTEHFARLVVARNRSDATNPHQLEWAEDMAESLIRYGRHIGWSRRDSPRMAPGMPRTGVQGTRRTVGHHHPSSRGYLFPEEFLEAPADIPPESWITAPREARTWYAPPYAPDFRGLESQMARFRRGDSLLVVGAFRPEAEEPAGPGVVDDDPFAPRDAFDPAPGPDDGGVETGLFLVEEDGRERHHIEDRIRGGVLTLRAPTGRYVASLEVFEPDAEAAWRARHGIVAQPLGPGEAAPSDILLLEPDAPYPESLEEAIPHARRGIEIRQGEPFTVVWEAYGMEVEEPAQVTMGFTSGRPGFLRRVGEFLGIVETDVPVEVSFEETGPDEVDRVFRAMELRLPELDPDDYTIHLRLELPGREPVETSRPVTIVP